MQRVTVTLDDELMADLDRLIAEKGYANRSEAVRDLARAGLRQAAVETGSDRPCVGILSYVYAHGARDLARRMTGLFHDHHDLTLSSLHLHLDHESCLEVSLLKGPAARIEDLGGQVIAERAVRHGALALIPLSERQIAHDDAHARGHDHPHGH